MIADAGEGYRILKVFNNSVVLAQDELGRETVLLGRGVGFQKAGGDRVDADRIERRFLPGENTSDEQLRAYLSEIPSADLALAQQIIAHARKELGVALSDAAILPLADHITVAVARARDEVALDYPLRWEVASLYPDEVAFARRAVAVIEEACAVTLPASEAVPLALHFVNAQFGAVEVSTVMGITAALEQCLEIVRGRLSITGDEDSAATARFITHLRFLISRSMNGVPVATMAAAVGAALRASNEREYRIANEIADGLERRFDWSVGEDERLYLTLHVARLSGQV